MIIDVIENNKNPILTQYFPDIDLEESDFSQFGYAHVFVSVFDHWLSESEAGESKIITYSTALEDKSLDGYLEGESRFLNLYFDLADDGVVINRNGPPYSAESNNPGFRNILIDSMREKRLMDVYFLGVSTRVIGRYDRTDLLLLKNPSSLSVLQKKIQEHGLYMLS